MCKGCIRIHCSTLPLYNTVPSIPGGSRVYKYSKVGMSHMTISLVSYCALFLPFRDISFLFEIFFVLLLDVELFCVPADKLKNVTIWFLYIKTK